MKKCIYALIVVLGSLMTSAGDEWNVNVSDININVNMGSGLKQ